MKILSAGGTDKGRTRKNNEDSFLVDDGLRLYAVADGIGGHQGGEVASRMAVETLREMMKDYAARKGKTPAYGLSAGIDPAVSALSYAFKLANTKLRETGWRDPRFSGMGTTMTAVLLKGTTAHLAHIGDSRAYLLRAGGLDQLSEDHGVVAEQVRSGLISPEQARRSPYRHLITRAIGIDPELLLDHRAVDMKKNDTLLLCTDGLTEMVEDPEITRIVSNAASPAAAAEKLIAAANDRGGVDNITVVVIKIAELG